MSFSRGFHSQGLPEAVRIRQLQQQEEEDDEDTCSSNDDWLEGSKGVSSAVDSRLVESKGHCYASEDENTVDSALSNNNTAITLNSKTSMHISTATESLDKSVMGKNIEDATYDSKMKYKSFATANNNNTTLDEDTSQDERGMKKSNHSLAEVAVVDKKKKRNSFVAERKAIFDQNSFLVRKPEEVSCKYSAHISKNKSLSTLFSSGMSKAYDSKAEIVHPDKLPQHQIDLTESHSIFEQARLRRERVALEEAQRKEKEEAERKRKSQRHQAHIISLQMRKETEDLEMTARKEEVQRQQLVEKESYNKSEEEEDYFKEIAKDEVDILQGEEGEEVKEVEFQKQSMYVSQNESQEVLVEDNEDKIDVEFEEDEKIDEAVKVKEVEGRAKVEEERQFLYHQTQREMEEERNQSSEAEKLQDEPLKVAAAELLQEEEERIMDSAKAEEWQEEKTLSTAVIQPIVTKELDEPLLEYLRRVVSEHEEDVTPVSPLQNEEEAREISVHSSSPQQRVSSFDPISHAKDGKSSSSQTSTVTSHPDSSNTNDTTIAPKSRTGLLLESSLLSPPPLPPLRKSKVLVANTAIKEPAPLLHHPGGGLSGHEEAISSSEPPPLPPLRNSAADDVSSEVTKTDSNDQNNEGDKSDLSSSSNNNNVEGNSKSHQLPLNEAGDDAAATLEEVVTALYSFTGVEPEDLTFKEGDQILILEKMDANWWKGQDKTSGDIGIFPSSYVEQGVKQEEVHQQVVPSCMVVLGEQCMAGDVVSNNGEFVPVNEQVLEEAMSTTNVYDVKKQDSEEVQPEPLKSSYWYALYPYSAKEVEDMTLEVGDQITLISKEEVQPGWLKGHNHRTGVTGIFPSSYVQEQEPRDIETVSSMSSSYSEPCMVGEEGEDITAAAVLASSPAVLFTAVALYDFASEGPEELSFLVGETIDIVEMVDDNWWRGFQSSSPSKQALLLPCSYVTREMDVGKSSSSNAENSKQLPSLVQHEEDRIAPSSSEGQQVLSQHPTLTNGRTTIKQ